jgi:hypothetical protein
MLPVAEKVQHVPTLPWSLTSKTAPFSLQSKELGASIFGVGRYLSVGNTFYIFKNDIVQVESSLA